MRPIITDLRSLRPRFTSTQDQTLRWLQAAHTEAEATSARQAGRALDRSRFHDEIGVRLRRFGCDGDRIATRGYELADCGHTRWAEMQVYRLHERPNGEGTAVRTRVFAQAAQGALDRLYAERDRAPEDLLHVTCTGYLSPSAAQLLLSAKGWGASTRVLHLYHMGCYAAFPALRVATGLCLANGPKARCEIAHTELCSLHLNPLLHTPEQFAVQTLFADGFIAYALCDVSAWDGRSGALELLAQDERVLPDSSGAMAWWCSDWGMQMSLSREVPERLGAVLVGFVEGLCERAGLDRERRRDAHYAVHPGGPRILDVAERTLALRPAQLRVSRDVLRAHGNMSSATLPHIWMQLASSPEIAPGHPIVSLAFGPGLTICGAVLRKLAP